MWTIAGIVALLLLLFILLKIPTFQNFAAQKVVNYISNKIGTPVKLQNLSLDFPKMLVLEGVYFEDQKQDTLFAGDKLKVDINLFKLFKNTVQIDAIELEGITASIKRTLPDSAFNFDYILNAFSNPDELEKEVDSTHTMIFRLDKINLDRIALNYSDEVLGLEANLFLSHLNTRIKKFDLQNNSYEIPKIDIDGFLAKVKQEAQSPQQEPEPLPYEFTTVEESGIPFDVKTQEINLKNIHLSYQDKATEMLAQLVLKKSKIDFNELDLRNERIDLKSILIEDSKTNLSFGKAPNKQEAPVSASDTTSLQWVVKAAQIELKNSELQYDDFTFPVLKKGLDYSHLHVKDLNTQLNDFYFAIDSIQGDVKQLFFQEKSGFQVQEFHTNFLYSEHQAFLKDFFLATPNSQLRNNVFLTYPSLKQLIDQPEKIGIDAQLLENKLGMKDVILLLPDLDTMKVLQPLKNTHFNFQGELSGKVAQLQIPHLNVEAPNQTRLRLSGSVAGLPDVEKVILNLNLTEFSSTRRDLESLIEKSLLPDSLTFPENINLTGTFVGGMKSFDTNLKLNTSLGSASLDGTISLGETDTLYQARVAVENLNVGSILQDTTYGEVSFIAAVDGKSLDPSKATGELNFNLIKADFMGYSYGNIGLEGKAENGNITANLRSEDPNVQVNGTLESHIKDSTASLQLSLLIDSINFKNLKLSEEELKYQGKIVGDFSNINPDYLNGELRVLDSYFSYKGNTHGMDTLFLNSVATPEYKYISIDSEFLDAHIMGDYLLTQIFKAIQDVTHTYYNPENIPVLTDYAPQSFEFSVELTRSRLIRELLPELKEMANITLDGNFSSEGRSLNARISAPHTVYEALHIDSIGFDLNTADSTFYYTGNIGEFQVSNIQIINTLIAGTVKNDSLDFGLWIKDEQEKEQYHFGANLIAQQKDFIFKLKQDGLTLNSEKWKIGENNRVSFGERGIHVQDFELENDNQRLFANSESDSLNAPIEIDFENFRIETFTKFLETDSMKVGGGINGKVRLDRLATSPVFESSLLVDKFYFSNDTIGNIDIKVDNKRSNIYAAQISVDGNGNQFALEGDVNTPENAETTLDLTLAINRLNMSTIEAFSFGSLKESTGMLHGQLAITGTIEKPVINGDLNFEQARTIVSMLNAPFKFDKQTINFNPTGLSLNQFQIIDSVGNSATLNGKVLTPNYRDFNLDLTLNSNNFQVVNSSIRDNDLFFGKLFLTSNLRIGGTAESPIVDGTILVNENTNLSIVYTEENPGIEEREGIVEFIDKSAESLLGGTPKKDTLAASSVTGMEISLNLEVDPKAAFHVLIAGDEVTAKGKAELTAGIDSRGNISLTGTYEVSEGSYNLTFDFLKRKFNFRKGSTITWSGDPLSADLNITADYEIRTSPIDLVEAQLGGQNTGVYKEKLPFQVNLFIRGEMMSPVLSFGIDLSDENTNVSQDVISTVNTRLAQISENESELNKQVFSLIVLGRFMAENPFSSSANTSVESMARESVSKLLSSQLNRLAGDLIQGVELNFDLEATDDYSSGSLENRTDLNLGVSKRLLNDRLKITVGNNFQLEGANQPGRKETNIAGDITIDYQLSRDGRYMVRAYRKNEYEVALQGQVIETGLGFIITMDYDVFKELFLNAKQLERLRKRKERVNRVRMLNEQTREARREEREARRAQREADPDEESKQNQDPL